MRCHSFITFHKTLIDMRQEMETYDDEIDKGFNVSTFCEITN